MNIILQALLLPFFWIFCFLYFTGLGFTLMLFKKFQGILSKNIFNFFWYGLGIIVMFLQVWNLYLPITFHCWLPLLPFVIIGCYNIYNNKFYFNQFLIKSYKVHIFLFIILIFLVICSLNDVYIFDSIVYHFYMIKWLNNYRSVLGIGNLDYYLGLAGGQSFFIIPAFLNALWGHYQGACAVGGLLVLVISVEIILKNYLVLLNPKHININSAFQILFLPFCIRAGTQVLSSPSPDIFNNLLTFKIFSILLECLTNKKNTFQDIYIIVFLLVFGTIARMSFIGVFFGAFVILIYLFKNLANKPTIFLKTESVFIYLMLFIPWLIRTTFSTGYLGFPTSKFGLKFDWVMSKKIVDNGYNYIVGYARTHSFDDKIFIPSAKNTYNWFPLWFNYTIKSFSFTIPLIISTFCLIFILTNKIYLGKLKLIFISIMLSLLFWFYNAPDIRFATNIFWTLAFIPLAVILSTQKYKINKYFPHLIFTAVTLFVIRNWNLNPQKLGIVPKNCTTIYITKSKLKIHIPPHIYQNFIGDCDSLCTLNDFENNVINSNISLRGKNVEDGFKTTIVK